MVDAPGDCTMKFVVAEANTAITNNCNGDLVTYVKELFLNFSTPSGCTAMPSQAVFVVTML